MAPIIVSIVSQHAEEAAFLWLLRNNAVHAPHYALKDLAKLDERVEAHLDGLRIAGDGGWEICKEGLGQQEPGEVFAAAVLAFESGDKDRISEVLEVGCQSVELSRGVISALGWLPYLQAKPHVDRLLTSDSALHRRIGIAVAAARRQDPGVVLESTLSSTDLWLKARSLKAVGELGRNDLLPVVKSNLNSEDPTSRFWAAWSGALLDEPSAIPVLQRLAEQGAERAESACAMAVRRMPVQAAHHWQRELAGRPETLRMAVQALGVIGDSAGIPWLIEQMAKPKVARVAGESLTMITGIDLAYEDLEGEKPEGFEAGPTENPEDENIEIDPDEDLPWPNPQLVERWWASHRLGFTNGTRYLLGKPMTVDWFNEVLRTGKQRQRTAAAIELSMREPGRPLFNTSAPGFRQQVLLQVR
ncbi:MAG: hypothetical protein UZ03_NOB001002691 [Nitrospira sp. OLB3]|nr:MAG: hypothetical protein UZ03_NOB001002691 [Nitrospira sp. OLB3]MCE7965769.1 TIGR02270 family protein [Nitrospira sp. NTP2]MEB2339842.1 TIGR02270 family protein [Nitrospirales bacterium]